MWKEFRRLSPSTVQSVCISHRWYTNGNNEDYLRMLSGVDEFCKTGITADRLAVIAEDIRRHSENVKSLELIMWELGRVSDVSFYEESADED